MTCSRPQRNVHRRGIEPGTPWSEIRRPIHCATPPFSHVNHPSCFLLASQYMYITSCFTIRTKNKQKSTKPSLACPRSRNYLVYVRHGRKQRFFLCRAHVWLGKYTCIWYMYNCVFCLSQHRFRVPLSHMFDTPSNARLLLITVIVGKQHGGLCFKVLTHQTTPLHFDGKRKT